MAAFEFVALNPRGREEKGLIEGDTARHARQLLRDRGMAPLSVTEVSDKKSQGGKQVLPGKRGGLGASELSLFTRQLATLVRSGLPLDEALTAVAQQSESRKVQRIALGVRSGVMEGSTLASSLDQFPGAFPHLYRATIEAGEQSGKLDFILERLADYVENRQDMQNKMVSAAIYPIFLVIVCFAIVALMLTYVVPQVVGVYQQSGQKLPTLTILLIASSDFMKKWGITLLVTIVVAVITFLRLMKREGFKRKVDGNLLRVPLVGRLVRGANTGRFMRTLGILFSSGVPILDAMRIGTQVVSNLPMKDAVDAATIKVREGTSLSKALGAARLFPPISIHLIGSGESSGKLDEMLDRAAINQERELENMTTRLMSIMGPSVILLMGVLVLLIVLGMLLPIFELNSLVQ